MYYLYESSDTLNTPVECFLFDAAKDSFPVKPHWHYFMEMLYIMDGRIEAHINGKQYFLAEGDMILFHPNAVHSIYAVDNKLPRYAVFKFDINRLSITPNYAPKLRSIFKSAEKKEMQIFFDNDIAASLDADKIFTNCISEMVQRKYGFDLVVKADIYKLLLGIIRIWNDTGFQVDSAVFGEDNHCDIYNITEYIDANMDVNIKVSDIATKCGMSYSYFAKQFLAVYGKTCKEYIEAMRLFKAEELLIFTDFDLNYISQETGFSDCSHMIKCFKRFMGITPKQFRMEHLEKK